MYKKPPTETLGITEFEERALERLKILKAVERAGVTHIKGKNCSPRQVVFLQSNLNIKQFLKQSSKIIKKYYEIYELALNMIKLGLTI